MSVLAAAIGASISFAREGEELAELRVGERSFIGACNEIWEGQSEDLKAQLLVGPVLDWPFTQPTRWCTNDAPLTPNRAFMACRVSISKAAIEQGIKLAAPRGWLLIKLTDEARLKMLSRFSR